METRNSGTLDEWIELKVVGCEVKDIRKRENFVAERDAENNFYHYDEGRTKRRGQLEGIFNMRKC